MQTNLATIKELFAKMQADNFDVNSFLKWSFYFVDTDKQKLKAVYEELKDSNYVFEKIYKIKGENRWTLFTSKVGVLTPEKLHRRNIAFNELATYCGIELYDGWDVEKLSVSE